MIDYFVIPYQRPGFSYFSCFPVNRQSIPSFKIKTPVWNHGRKFWTFDRTMATCDNKQSKRRKTIAIAQSSLHSWFFTAFRFEQWKKLRTVTHNTHNETRNLCPWTSQQDNLHLQGKWEEFPFIYLQLNQTHCSDLINSAHGELLQTTPTTSPSHLKHRTDRCKQTKEGED